MNKIILATGCDSNYLNTHHFQNYLKTIEKNSNIDLNVLVYFGNNEISINSDKINIAYVNPQNVKALTSKNCLQHGEFLNSEYFNSISDEDVIIFTDGDMELQRNFTEEELTFIRNLKDNEVYVGYNESPTDTLLNEYYRLSPLKPHFNLFPINIGASKIYNTGVLCMNKKTWNRLKDEYVDGFSFINGLFIHYAKQQWLICLLFSKNNYKIFEMSYEIHNHNHYPPAVGSENKNGVVTYKNKIVLFKHRWF